LADADYRIANLECAVSAGGAALPNKRYTFRADPRVTGILKGRFDALGVANNHSGDFGKDAFSTRSPTSTAPDSDISAAGAILAEAHAPLWIERKGLRIAVLGYNEFKPRSFEAGPAHPGIAWSEDAQVIPTSAPPAAPAPTS
jgi:poly-gamma-glutamate synthesis protein (capsule biosynthesis protein)